MGAPIYACNLGRAFAQTAELHNDHPAIRTPAGHDFNYETLNAVSDGLARWLLDQKVGPGAIVALQNAKTLYGYASMLACLKVGAAYTNLDSNNPVERLRRILSVCCPVFVLCDESPAPSVIAAAALASLSVIDLRDHRAELETRNTD